MLTEIDYPHRRNSDRTWDSICNCCFLTIAHGRTESELAEGEKTHVCHSSFIAERGLFSERLDSKLRGCFGVQFNKGENRMLQSSDMKVLVADDE